MREWLKAKLKLMVVTGIIVLLVLFIVSFVGGYWLKWNWTGFPAKTEWDWLNLLGVFAIPVVVGLGAAWYTAQQGKVSDRENTDNQREVALQAYIDKMSELLLMNNLRQSAEDDEVRKIARVRTLTVLRGLDSRRKASLLQFLYEAGLVNQTPPIIDLAGADLSRADLSRADLSRAVLAGVNLNYANLNLADLTQTMLFTANLKGANLSLALLGNSDLGATNLSEANLSKAYLEVANLHEANLSGACLADVNGTTDSQLNQAKSLQGATMPDGSIHP